MTTALFILFITLAALPLLLKSLRSLTAFFLWLCIAAAFGLLIAQPKLFITENESLILSEIDPLKLASTMQQAKEISVRRDTISPAQWQSLDARPINWLENDAPLFNMAFQSITTVGRQWELHLNFNQSDDWYAELIDESDSVIAHTEAKNQAALQLTWLPVVAEPILLQLRIFDRNKKLIEQGPIAIDVQKAQSFSVQLELAAPNFDANALRRGIESSGLRWQVTTQLGANTQWQHQSDRDAFSTHLLIIDSRRFEQAKSPERERWLNKAAHNTPVLIVDFSNQLNTAYWKNNWNLSLRETPESPSKLTQWPVSIARHLPSENQSWQALRYDKRGSTGLWKYHNKKIFWLALQGWHDAQINSPNTIKNFWQHIFDALPVSSDVDEIWQPTTAMPTVNQRTELCLNTTHATRSASIWLNGDAKSISLYDTPSSNVLRCTAIWPSEKGWIKISSEQASANYYIYDKIDWPSWQKQLAREGAKVFEARRPQQTSSSNKKPIADWILIIAATLALLVIWWRETKLVI